MKKKIDKVCESCWWFRDYKKDGFYVCEKYLRDFGRDDDKKRFNAAINKNDFCSHWRKR